MDSIGILIAVGVIYGALLFFDLIFKSCAHYPYTAFLHGSGIHIGILYVRWHTSAFNKALVQLVWRGRKTTRFLQLWFTIGVYCTLFLLPIATVLIFKSGFESMISNSSDEPDNKGPTLELYIPGINLPIDQIGYYSLTMIICSLIHELGHALAAVVEDVQLLGVGVNVLFIIPIAYVEIKTESLNTITAFRKLKILCAGIWHNIIVAFVLYLIFITLPTMFTPLYGTNKSVIVTEIKLSSPLLGSKGLSINDEVYVINNCPVLNSDNWYQCLASSLQTRPAVCVSTDLAHKLDESISTKHLSNGLIVCCEESDGQNACFEYIEPINGILELPQHMCLPIRKILENSYYCNIDKLCDNDDHCIKPVIHNSSALIHLKRVNKPDVIFIGHPSDIFRSVHVSNFIPKYKFLSPMIPEHLKNLLQYIVTFSLGLAVINVIPCFWFDGQHIIKVLVHFMLSKTVKLRSVRNTIALSITVACTFVIIMNFASVLWKKIV